MLCFSYRIYRLLYIILVDCSDILDFSEPFLCLNFDLALVLAGRNASSNIEAGLRLDPFTSSSYRLVQLNSGNAHKTFEASTFDSQNRSNRDGARNEKYAPQLQQSIFILQDVKLAISMQLLIIWEYVDHIEVLYHGDSFCVFNLEGNKQVRWKQKRKQENHVEMYQGARRTQNDHRREQWCFWGQFSMPCSGTPM
jgi:hypothetical protein